jgi:hypothetical protein
MAVRFVDTHSTWVYCGVGCSMRYSSLIVALSIAGLVVFRLLWLLSQTAAAAGLERLPFLRKGLRRWLFGERGDAPTPVRPGTAKFLG